MMVRWDAPASNLWGEAKDFWLAALPIEGANMLPPKCKVDMLDKAWAHVL